MSIYIYIKISAYKQSRYFLLGCICLAFLWLLFGFWAMLMIRNFILCANIVAVACHWSSFAGVSWFSQKSYMWNGIFFLVVEILCYWFCKMVCWNQIVWQVMRWCLKNSKRKPHKSNNLFLRLFVCLTLICKTSLNMWYW